MNHAQRGYTLIELLAVTAILVSVGSLIIGVLYTTLRGSSKTNLNNVIAQNGNYALSVISNIAISSTRITAINGNPIADCTSPPPVISSIQFKRSDGGLTTLSCEALSPSITSVTSNSASLINTSQVKVDTSNPSNCYFKCSQPSGDPYANPIIEAGFLLRDLGNSAFVENVSSGSAFFKTSVQMRNYSP